jgi:hypothetical protein
MKNLLTQKGRILITTVVTLLIWGHVLWDYTHEGIPVHFILRSKDMPGIPNWWGAIVLPFFTYFLLFRISERLNQSENKESLQRIGLRFLGGILFAVSISVSFMNGNAITDYIMGLIFILAFVFPIYKSEYFLGWVFGSAFSFGAMIPILFGSMLCLIFFLIYQLVAVVKRVLTPKID